MKNLSAIILLLLSFTSSLVLAQDPKGWTNLKQTIEKTPFSEVSILLNRTFDLEVEGATQDYEFTIQPETAFKVERITSNKFRVTIINAEALVKRDLIVVYNSIGWNLKKIDSFIPNITGEANCSYNVIFSQPGVADLDLSKFGDDYDITYELSNPESISSVKREGKGYDIIRNSKSSAESKIRLRIKKKNGDFNLQTDWITIPLCKSNNTQISPPVTIPIPTEPSTPPAKDQLSIKISHITFCENTTGEFCSTLDITATNIGNSNVKCNEVWFYMKYNNNIVAKDSTWIDLIAGQTTTFQIVLKAPNKPENKWTYQIEKRDCFYK
jgi:hypothetical protein